MTQVGLILVIFLGIGILVRSYNNWARLTMVFFIVSILVLFYIM